MRKLCCFAAPFAAAVFAAMYLLPESLWLPAGGFCALGALAGLPLQGDKRLRWVLIALGLAAGLSWSALYGAVFHAAPRALAGSETEMTATVTDWPRQASYGRSVAVRLHPDQGFGINALLYITPGEDGTIPDMRPGDELTFTARFRLANTIAGQESSYYYAKGTLLIAYASGAQVRSPSQVSPLHWPAYVSRALKESIARCFPEDAAPLVTALLTGDKTALPGGLYSALRRSGIAHVVAVSGLHVSFLAGLFSSLLGRRRRLAAVLGIGLMFFFAAAVGNTPSVLRAAFMQSMLLLAPLLEREDDRATSLSLILMLLLVQNPYAAASVSLQLSFAAVAGIYLFTGPLYRRWQARIPQGSRFGGKLAGRLLRFAAAAVATTLGAAVFTTPLTAYYFNMISLASPLTNLLVLWLVSAAFLGGLAAALLGVFLPGLAGLLALVVSLPVRVIQWVPTALAKLPFAAVGLESVYLRLWLLLVYVLLAAWLLWRGEKKRPLFPVGACALCLCAAIVFHAAGRTSGQLTVSALDVGQGLSVAFYAQGKAALVDCGGTGSEDPGDTAADYFQSLGLTRIDTVVLTHYHTDHACGVPQLLERLEVGLLVLPDVTPEEPLRQEIEALAAEYGVETLFITENTDLLLGNARLRIYAPLGDGGANEEGLSILCTSGEFDVLITGDMNTAVERRLIKYGDLPDIELLVAGHHGSKYATSEELLLATTPEYAVVSVGYNSYGHPTPEALERMAAAGCEIYRTDWMGTVTFTVREYGELKP